MRWITEHKLISVLILILLILAVIFAVSVFTDGMNNTATGAVNKGMSVISGGLSSVGNTIRDNITGLFAYKALQEQIDELENENDNLRRQLVETQLDREELEQLEELSGALNFEYASKKLDREDLEQLQELSELLNYQYFSKEFDMVTADITSLDGSNWTNIFTIDRGTESGIEAGDAVVNGMGLVGRIQETGDGWSKVVSIIDEDIQVSFKLVRDRKQLGVVSGNASASISGYMMDADSTVMEGDVLVTSGLGTYPRGLEIGNVKTVVYNSNTLLKEITVEPAVNFRGLEKVAVIK